MKIGGLDINENVFIIAEIGNNHEGNFGLAEKMIVQAAKAGADAVKFQTIIPGKFVTVAEEERSRQLKKFEFSYDQFAQLAKIAKENSLIFLTTPFDIEGVEAIGKFVPAYKISSGDNTFWPLLEQVSKKGKPILLSTGLIKLDELKKAVGVIEKNCPHGLLSDYLALLHCVSSYPTPNSDLNLLSIRFLQDSFGLPIGYSDHSEGVKSCIAAVALGARIIEKHFTYKKRGQTFGDHLLSAEPSEFKEMVKQIRDVEEMLGEYKKAPMPSESALSVVARRSIAAKRDLRSGEKIAIQDLTWLRPAVGFKTGEEHLLIGRMAKRDIKKGEIISKEDVS